VRGTG
jgi:hypothetical protein